FPDELPYIVNGECGERLFNEHELPATEMFVQASRHASIKACNVDQHIDCTQYLAVVADDGCRKRQEINANPIRALGYSRHPTNSMSGLDSDSHRTLLVRGVF